MYPGTLTVFPILPTISIFTRTPAGVPVGGGRSMTVDDSRKIKIMVDYKTIRNNDRGFSLIEMMVVVAIMMILAAFSVPNLMNMVSDVNLRYSATNLSGLLQTARIHAVRKNTFYGIQPVALPNGDLGYFVNLNGTVFASGDPIVPLGTQLQVFQGTGSGAPNEGAFVANLGFAVAPSTVVPSFNARGLPCSPTANTCPQNGAQGFVLFLKRVSNLGGIRWASVVVNPSGRLQTWSCDGSGNWLQR
jgi:prepilin-type N-terminal cleavage/methylation domain-containing protein